MMRTFKEIEAAIEQLPRDQLFHLREWLTSRFEEQWDKEIEEDIQAGRLDRLAKEARAEFRTGSTTRFPPDEE